MPPPRSPEAQYHAIPQALGSDLDDHIVPSDIELEADVETYSEDTNQASLDPPSIVITAPIRWIYFVLGCSVLLPWNVMITATPFFLSRLEGSPLQATFTSYLSMTFTSSNFIFLAHATAVSKRTSPSRQIRRSISWLSILTLLLTFSTFFRLSPGLFVAFILVNGAAQAAFGSYLQTSVVAIASLFGPQAIQAVMSGQAAVAVVVSGVQVLSSSFFLWRATPETIAAHVSPGQAEQRSARVFFALSTVFLVISIVAYNNMLVKKPSYKTLVAPLEQKFITGAGTTEERRSLTSTGPSDYASEKSRILRVAKTNLTFELAVSYVFIVTLAVFPPITASVRPTNPDIHPLLFNAVHFLVFNLGDFLGRYICAIPSLLIWSANKLMVLSLARTLFIPIFLMCNVQRPSMSLSTAPLISSDLLFMITLFAFGLSNGYVSSLCMMSAPSLEHNPRLQGRKDDVDVAATIASFSIVGGLAIGSIASFAVSAAICGCNPFTSMA